MESNVRGDPRPERPDGGSASRIKQIGDGPQLDHLTWLTLARQQPVYAELENHAATCV